MPSSPFDLSGAEARTRIMVQEQQRKRDQPSFAENASPLSRNFFVLRQFLVILALILIAVFLYHFFH